MTIAQIENLIRYVTNSEGKATDVIVPLESFTLPFIRQLKELTKRDRKIHPRTYPTSSKIQFTGFLI